MNRLIEDSYKDCPLFFVNLQIMQSFLKYLVSFILAIIVLILIVLPVVIFGLWSLIMIPIIIVTVFIKASIFDD